MKYLHNSSFEKTKAELEEKGCSYSNAVLISITSLIRYDAGDKGKVIEYADKIDTSSQHLLGIINDCFGYMNAHVSKPVEMKVLEKTIRSIKSGGGGTEPQVIEQWQMESNQT